MNIRWKFIISITSIILLSGFTTAFFVQITMTKTLTQELMERGFVIARNLANSIVDPLLTDDLITLKRHLMEAKNAEGDIAYAFVVDDKGFLAMHTFEAGFPKALLNANIPPPGQGGSAQLLDTEQGFIRDIAMPILGGKAGVLHLGISENRIRSEIARVTNIFIAGTIAIAIAGGILGSIVGSLITKPIAELVKGAEEIGKGNLDFEIAIASEDEIKVLARSFNEMAKSLKKSMQEIMEKTKEAIEAKSYIASITESSADAIISVDFEGKIKSWNKGAEQIFGYTKEEIMERKLDIIIPLDCQKNIVEKIEEAMQKNYVRNYETRCIRSDGNIIPVDLTLTTLRDSSDRIIGTSMIFRDLSEKKKMEKQLIQSEKLVSIGLLAAGVAHEINNPLTNILLDAEVLRQRKLNEAQVKQKLDEIISEVEIAARIVKNLLNFSRQSKLEFEEVDLRDIMERALSMVSRDLENIEVTRNYQEIPRIWVDSNQIQQVLVNILLNAIQAMPNGGKINIDISMSQGSEFAKIDISDTGVGIPEEYLDRIFDPFFTTKKGGTGLGLAICFGIVKEHGGKIEVNSQVGVGSTFTVYLPAGVRNG